MHTLDVSTVFCEFILIFTCFAFNPQTFYSDVAKIIHLKTRAGIHMKGSYGYHQKRKVQNGACDNIYPDLIVAPKSTQDVSTIVSIASNYKIPISVKSGGHSYICQGIKPGSNFKIINYIIKYHFHINV